MSLRLGEFPDLLKVIYRFFSVKLCVVVMHGLCIFLSFLPLNTLRFLAKTMGSCTYFLRSRKRKIALLNVKGALPGISKQECKRIAKASFQNIAIVFFEMGSFFKRKEKLFKIINFHGEQEVFSRLHQQRGVVFLIAHQANWEFFFPAINHRFPGIAVAKPFKNNHWLYEIVLAFREMSGGKIIVPTNAVNESLRALKRGQHVIFVDHTYRREGKYNYPFFGIPAYTSCTPALLAYRTKNPLVVLMNKRTEHGYQITFSPMIFPNFQNAFKQEVQRMMDIAMKTLEESISSAPGEWMWMYNRWKIPKNNNLIN